MTATEHLYVNERDAHTARRQLIDRGVSVSLVAYDPNRDRYTFDSYTAASPYAAIDELRERFYHGH